MSQKQERMGGFYLFVALVAIITSGAYLGNLINMGMVHAAFWLTLEPVAFMNDFASKFDLLVTTLPVTRLPSLLAIIVAIWLTRKTVLARNYWLGALVPVIFGLGLSLVYFLPMNNGLLRNHSRLERPVQTSNSGSTCIGFEFRCQWCLACLPSWHSEKRACKQQDSRILY